MRKLLLAAMFLYDFVAFFFPYTGWLFLVVMGFATVGHFTSFGQQADQVLRICSYLYVGSMLFTLVVTTTFSYQCCCIGKNSFWTHLKQSQFGMYLDCFLTAIFWPTTWAHAQEKLLTRNLTGYDLVRNALKFWLVTSWRGGRVEIVDLQTGQKAVVFARSPAEALLVAIAQMHRESKR